MSDTLEREVAELSHKEVCASIILYAFLAVLIICHSQKNIYERGKRLNVFIVRYRP
jgi:hypothetical protein